MFTYFLTWLVVQWVVWWPLLKLVEVVGRRVRWPSWRFWTASALPGWLARRRHLPCGVSCNQRLPSRWWRQSSWRLSLRLGRRTAKRNQLDGRFGFALEPNKPWDGWDSWWLVSKRGNKWRRSPDRPRRSKFLLFVLNQGCCRSKKSIHVVDNNFILSSFLALNSSTCAVWGKWGKRNSE